MESKIIVRHIAFESIDRQYDAASITVDSRASIKENLAFAYRWTQNIHDSWSKNMEHDGHERVTCLVDLTGRLGLRSTSVGDTITMIHESGFKQVYQVADIGFELIEEGEEE